MRSNYDKEVSIMGYTIMLDARGTGKGKYYKVQINNMEAKEKNRFAPAMTVNTLNLLGDNEYKIEIHTTGLGNLTLEEYPIYIEAMQLAFPVAQQFQGILNNFIKNN